MIENGIYFFNNKIYNRQNQLIFNFDSITYDGISFILSDTSRFIEINNTPNVYELFKYANIIEFKAIPENFMLFFSEAKITFLSTKIKKYNNVYCYISDLYFYFINKQIHYMKKYNSKGRTTIENISNKKNNYVREIFKFDKNIYYKRNYKFYSDIIYEKTVIKKYKQKNVKLSEKFCFSVDKSQYFFMYDNLKCEKNKEIRKITLKNKNVLCKYYTIEVDDVVFIKALPNEKKSINDQIKI